MNDHMLLFSLCLLGLGLFQLSEAKCKYRASSTGVEGIRAFRRCLPSNSQIPDEYWSTVSYDGELKGGRTKADFMTFDGQGSVSNGWVGYWITRSRYPGGKHYESFGHVFEKPDGRLCGWFVGLNSDEMVEVCGGFRVLSRSRHNPNEENPFEWIQAANAIPRNSLGFHHHRIARYQPLDGNAFYGDAKLQAKEFMGISPESQRITQINAGPQFEDDVWVLKRKRDNAFGNPNDFRRPTLPPPPPPTTQDPNHIWRYFDPHEHRGIPVDDRRLRYPDGRVEQLGYPSDPRYSAYQNDPRYQAYQNDPRYSANYYRDSRLHVNPYNKDGQDQRYSPYESPQNAADPYKDSSAGGGHNVGTGVQPVDYKDLNQPQTGHQIGTGAEGGNQGGSQSGYQIGQGAQLSDEEKRRQDLIRQRGPLGQYADQSNSEGGQNTYGSGDNQLIGGYRPLPHGNQGQTNDNRVDIPYNNPQHQAGHGYHLAPAHRPVIVTDQYGRKYEKRLVNGVAHYLYYNPSAASGQSNQPVIPPRDQPQPPRQQSEPIEQGEDDETPDLPPERLPPPRKVIEEPDQDEIEDTFFF